MLKLLKWLKRSPRTLEDMTMKEFTKEIRKNLVTNQKFIEEILK